MAKGGGKGKPGGGGPGGSSLILINGDDNHNDLNGDVLFPLNEDLGYEIYGNGGNDILTGGANNDRLVGGAGADELYGNGGDDYLEADLEDTVIDGGGDTHGADATPDAGDTLRTVNITYVDLSLGDTGTYDSETGTPTIVNSGVISGIENVLGGANDQLIIGDGEANYINGGGGDDRIEGVGGNDLLEGSDGDDLLIGGSGDDHYIGGAGEDTFVVGDGNDVIFDFNTRKNDSVEHETGEITGGDLDSAGDLNYGNPNKVDTKLTNFGGEPGSTVIFVDTVVTEDDLGWL